MAGTKVKTLDGDKNIEDIEVGDEVWSCDAEAGETGSKHVTRLSVNEARDIAHVTIDGETIDATTTHPFYVEGDGFKPAGQLLVGEKVRLLDGVDGETSGIGEVEAVTIEHLDEPVKVYNFEVEDWHIYYVAELGVLVHNQGCGSIGTEIELLLSGRSELTGTNREKLLTTVQDSKLSSIVNELYRPGAHIGDGGTASMLMSEFYAGESKHLNKAIDRLNELNRLAKTNNLSLNDLDVLDALRIDLENAIHLFE